MVHGMCPEKEPTVFPHRNHMQCWNDLEWFSTTSRQKTQPKSIAGWWFGTFFICPYIAKNHPNWLKYFSEGLKPPTRLSFCYASENWYAAGCTHMAALFVWLQSLETWHGIQYRSKRVGRLGKSPIDLNFNQEMPHVQTDTHTHTNDDPILSRIIPCLFYLILLVSHHQIM